MVAGLGLSVNEVIASVGQEAELGRAVLEPDRLMDDAMNEMLGVDGVEEAVIYMLAVGHPAAA